MDFVPVFVSTAHHLYVREKLQKSIFSLVWISEFNYCLTFFVLVRSILLSQRGVHLILAHMKVKFLGNWKIKYTRLFSLPPPPPILDGQVFFKQSVPGFT